MKRVAYIFPTSHHYRRPFHEKLRERLAAHDVDYTVVYSEAGAENRSKRDTVEIAWGNKVGMTLLPRGLIYQHGFREALRADLVIVQQENKLLLNYILNLASLFGLKRVAYFGHGRNFQARDPHGPAERWKRFWATRCDWWFAYTEESRRHVESLGFPPERITVFNNAIDTGALAAAGDAIDDAEAAAFAASLGVVGEDVGIFVGGLYPDKRLPFLIEAADRVRAHVPGFTLLIVGGGVERAEIEGLAATRPWVIVAGPRFGREKALLLRAARLFLMPGLLGLAVLDAGALGLPVVTTRYPWHSPEIAYLRDGETGVIVDDWTNPEAYAQAVVALLEDEARRHAMARAARAYARDLTIEAMAERFAEGAVAALTMPVSS